MILRLSILLCAGCTGSEATLCQVPLAGPGDHALVLTDHTDQFDAGTLTVVDLDSREVCNGVVAATADSVVHVAQDDTIVEIGRRGFDRLRLFDPGSWRRPTAEFSVGSDSNPHDAALCGGAWWVSRYDSPSLQAFDERGQRVASVDLSPFADDDGIPEVSSLLTNGDTLTAGLQRLDRLTDPQRWQTTGPGLAVHIDCAAETVLGTAEIPGNATLSEGLRGYVAAGEHAVVTGNWTDEPTQISGFEHTVSAAAFTDQNYGVAISATDEGWHLLHCVAPDGATTELLATDAYIPAVSANDRGEIWVAVRLSYADADARPAGWPVRTDLQTGLLVVDPVDCVVTDEVNTELGPYSLAFY